MKPLFKVGDKIVMKGSKFQDTYTAIHEPTLFEFNTVYTVKTYKICNPPHQPEDKIDDHVITLEEKQAPAYHYFAQCFELYVPPVQDEEFREVMHGRSRMLEI